jgi:hypothetical protein
VDALRSLPHHVPLSGRFLRGLRHGLLVVRAAGAARWVAGPKAKATRPVPPMAKPRAQLVPLQPRSGHRVAGSGPGAGGSPPVAAAASALRRVGCAGHAGGRRSPAGVPACGAWLGCAVVGVASVAGWCWRAARCGRDDTAPSVEATPPVLPPRNPGFRCSDGLPSRADMGLLSAPEVHAILNRGFRNRARVAG